MATAHRQKHMKAHLSKDRSIVSPMTRLLFIMLFALPCFGTQQVPASPLQALDESIAANPGKTGVYVLEKGEESLLARAWLADHAVRSIDVQYFIWSTDNIGILASEALLRAADRGVRVRVIVDDVVIDAEDETILLLAAHPNVEIRIYNPRHIVGVPWWKRIGYLLTDFRASNQRMHDKTATFDGTVAITGGRNMADEYYDYDHAYNFRDRDILLVGGVVADVQASFERFWRSDLSVPIERQSPDAVRDIDEKRVRAYRDQLERYANNDQNFAPEVRAVMAGLERDFPGLVEKLAWTDVRFISDPPGKNDGGKGLAGGSPTTRILTEQMRQARKRVTIQTPYLVLPEGGLAFFGELVQRNVEVRVVTNSLASTDNLQAFSGYHKQRDDILAAGIEVYEFKHRPAIQRQLIDRYDALDKTAPIFAIHAKTLVVDGETTFIGTFNLDPRSANLNTEVGALVDDKAIAAEVEASIERDMLPENSWNPAVDNPDNEVSLWKRFKLWFWKLWPLEPIL